MHKRYPNNMTPLGCSHTKQDFIYHTSRMLFATKYNNDSLMLMKDMENHIAEKEMVDFLRKCRFYLSNWHIIEWCSTIGQLTGRDTKAINVRLGVIPSKILKHHTFCI